MALGTRALFARLREQSLLADAGRLLSGSLASLLISLAFSPILSRVFNPAEFGSYGLFVSVVSLGTVVAALRFENAVVLPADDDTARRLFRLSFFCILFTSSLAAGLSLLVYAFGWAGALTRNAVVLWVAPGMLLTALYQLYTFWRVRRRQYAPISSTRLLRAGAVGSSQLIMGLASLGVSALIVGQVLGQVIAAWSIARKTDADDEGLLRKPSRDPSLARSYRQFPMFDLPQALLNSASQQLPVFLLTTVVDAVAAGLYVMASRVLMVPILMAGQSIRPVLLQATSAAKNAHKPVCPLLKRAVGWLAGIGAPPTLVLLVFGPKIFELILGAQWHEAGRYAAIIAPWLFLVFVKEAVLGVVPVLGQQRPLLAVEGASLVGRVIAMLAGAYFAGGLGAMMGLSIVGTCANAVTISLLLMRAQAHDRRFATLHSAKD